MLPETESETLPTTLFTNPAILPTKPSTKPVTLLAPESTLPVDTLATASVTPFTRVDPKSLTESVIGLALAIPKDKPNKLTNNNFFITQTPFN